MAIGTDAAIGFVGTQDGLGTSSAAVANNAFSIAGDLSIWVNDDDALSANLVLLANFSVAPDVNSVINLYLRPLGIEGANNATIPEADFQNVYAGSFLLNDTTVAQYIPLSIDLFRTMYNTSQQYEYYIENKSGQEIPAAWDIFVLPTAIGPHP